MPLTLGDQIGRIIGAPPATVCIHQNVSVAEAEIGERNRIVYERKNFPSMRYVYQARRDLAVSATDDVVAAIDERTLRVPVQHLPFKAAETRMSRRSSAAARGGVRRSRRVPVSERRRAERALRLVSRFSELHGGRSWSKIAPEEEQLSRSFFHGSDNPLHSIAAPAADQALAPDLGPEA